MADAFVWRSSVNEESGVCLDKREDNEEGGHKDSSLYRRGTKKGAIGR